MAKSLMAKSKYPNGFTTSLIVDASTAGVDKAVAELVQAQLKTIGITVNIQVLDDATALAKTTSPNYEMAVAI
jgi:ABC-type transport system substrate-binding protein